MRNAILLLAVLLMCSSSFGQDANNQPLGGKTTESASKSAPPKKQIVSKPAPNQNKSSYSPCGVYYKSRAEMTPESNLPDKWFSLGQSANKHFWYNAHRTTCDPKTSVVRTWIKEDHKETDGNYALVLYELKCQKHQMRVKTVIDYDNTGSVLDTNDHADDPWQDVAPRTAGESIIRTVCRQS